MSKIGSWLLGLLEAHDLTVEELNEIEHQELMDAIERNRESGNRK